MSTIKSGFEVVRSFNEIGQSVSRVNVIGGQARAWNSYTGGPNGGFLIDDELFQSVWDKARTIDGPLQRCLFLTTRNAVANWPAFDESSRVAGSRFGGLVAKWQGTTDDQSLTSSASIPTISNLQFTPKRVSIYSQPFSNDLLQDTLIVERMLDYAVCQELCYSVTDKMVNGLGSYEPLGVINAASSIQVSRAGSTNVAQSDIDSMWSKLWPFCRRNAIWICNDDTLLKVDAVATTLGWPAATYLPQGVYGNPFALLKGRPLIPCEQCPILGAKGDLILGDWSQYGLVARNTNDSNDPGTSISYGSIESFIEKKSSEHFFFDTDSSVFRFKLRIDGMPLWKNQVTIANGSQLAGPFAVLV